MKQSIESIWKQGFIKNDGLVVPKITDLYNQKSKNIVDKLHRLFDLNNKFIILLAIVLLSLLSYVGAPVLGLFYAVLLMIFVIVGNNALAGLALVSKKVSSYHYLKSFDSWLKGIIATNTKIYRFVYPAMLLGGVIQGLLTEVGQSILKGVATDYPATLFVFGVPVYFLMLIVLLTGALSYFAPKIYYADMYLVYGSTFKKLEEIIKDMEVLRNE